MDLAGNPLVSPFSWTFGIQEQDCGQAEFVNMATSGLLFTYLINTMTPLLDGGISVAAYNPDHKKMSWLQNTRIEHIDLLYRKSESMNWLPALNPAGFPAEFFDDVSSRILSSLTRF
jgi:hypothetical protein